MTNAEILAACRLTAKDLSGGDMNVRSPIDGSTLATIRQTPVADMPGIIARAGSAFKYWRDVPAPPMPELAQTSCCQSARLACQLPASAESLSACR